ncbi:hypothetical protein KBC89_05360 [Candidatus Woesebacteria bacterium]|nr:hypothetical protein [Candidatus Woesebacteria bacterium]
MKNKVRPLYSRLQGLLSQAPILKESYTNMEAEPLCSFTNATIDQLSQITGNDYSIHKFESEIEGRGQETSYINLAPYKGKIGSLIAELHGTYFFDEQAPFSGMPNMIINQNSHQTTSLQVSILLEVQSKLDEKIAEAKLPEEKSFLESVKSQLSTVRNVVDLITLILKTAQSFGISSERVSQILS